MKKLTTLTIACALLFGATAAVAQARTDTFVKRGHAVKVQFGPTGRTATAHVRCPGNSSLASGYVSFVNDSTPFGAKVVAQDVTEDEQGWEATVQTTGLYVAGEETTTATFLVSAICIA